MDRRHAIKLIAGTGLSIYLSPHLPLDAEAAQSTSLSKFSPIDRTISDVAPKVWYSDYPEKAHTVLWNKSGYVSSLGNRAPVPQERVPLVIIGGGISGLISAYLLKKFKPIILEQAPRLGGNSKGQSWRGVDYSIGAAYFVKPDAGSPIDVLVRELGLDSHWKIKKGEDPIQIGDSIFSDFWSGKTAEGDYDTKKQILDLKRYFIQVLGGEEVKFPEIPVTDPAERSYINSLDGISFKDHLENIARGSLAPSVEAVIEQYCWSSFGASSTAISAAAGLNFYAAEFGETVLLPGGNAAIGERIVQKLLSSIPLSHVRTQSLVYDAKVIDDGVVVSYQDDGGAPHAIHAKQVIMACPKFVVGKVLSDIEDSRLNAIKKLKYHSYLVANVCIKGGGDAPFYDLYLLGDGTVDTKNIRASAERKKVTDVIYANYARASKGSTVLTLYRALPYDGARVDLLSPDSYSRYRAEFEKQIHETILPLLKISSDRLVDLRIARWDHPLPVAAPGLISQGVVDELRKPFKDRIFFVEQDNWALPAFETSATEAITWAKVVAEKLAQGK